MRELNAVADLAGRAVRWWGVDELSGPHQPSMRPNGSVLVFDNGVAEQRTRLFVIDASTERRGPMRVLIVIRSQSGVPGGVGVPGGQIGMIQIARSLARRGVAVELFVKHDVVRLARVAGPAVRHTITTAPDRMPPQEGIVLYVGDQGPEIVRRFPAVPSVTPFDVEGFHRHIDEALDGRAALVDRPRITDYDWNGVVRRYEAVYRSTLRRTV